MKKWLIGILMLLMTTGYVATNTQVADLDKQITILDSKIKSLEKKSVLSIAEGAAGTKMYGAVTLEGGYSVGAMDRFISTSLATGDLCLVIDSNGIVYFYRYSSTSALTENTPWVITPTDSPVSGRWILANSIYLKNDDTNPSSIRFYEDYTTGQNYYLLRLAATSRSLLNASVSFSPHADR